ncbi:MAG: NAD-dependent deacylase, partial [Opitutaceae bacterium]|nr:NAD-dependent deacylase [Cytophagales bacterium]
ESLIYDMNGWELKQGDKCEKGSQLRPHIVWFGEEVPMMSEATNEAMKADIFIVIGTSLVVYPAAGLVDYAPRTSKIFVVDQNIPYISPRPNLVLIEEKATIGMQIILKDLMPTE